MVHTKQAANADFAFQKIFGDSDFMAAGQLLIPPKGMKPTKGTKDNTFVRTPMNIVVLLSNLPHIQIFYLIEGAVTFRVHRTSYVLTTGSMFMVPRGTCQLTVSPMHFHSDVPPLRRKPVPYSKHLRSRREALLRPGPKAS